MTSPAACSAVGGSPSRSQRLSRSARPIAGNTAGAGDAEKLDRECEQIHRRGPARIPCCQDPAAHSRPRDRRTRAARGRRVDRQQRQRQHIDDGAAEKADTRQ